MKGERRHELQHNDLLVWTNRFVEKIKPQATLITLLVVLAVVALVGWKWWDWQSTDRAARAWDDLFGAMSSGNPVTVSNVAEMRPNSDVGHWAAVVAADMYLGTGCQELFTSKSQAIQNLEKAVQQYSNVLDESRTPDLRRRATYGLAKAYEALAGARASENDLEKAIETFQTLLSTWPHGPFAEDATRRIEYLQRKDTKEFYDKFVKFDPKPEFTPGSPADPNAPALDLKSLDEITPDTTPATSPESQEPAAGFEPQEPQPPQEPQDDAAPDAAGQPD